MRPVVAQRIIRQLLYFFLLLAIEEMLEMTEAQMAFSDAHQRRTALWRFTIDRLVADGDSEGARGGNAQVMQRLGGEKFAHRGADHGASVAHPRVRGKSGALQMPVDFVFRAEALFAQQNAAAVAQLTGPDAELMSAIDLRKRLHPGQQRGAMPYAMAFAGEKRRVDAQRLRQRRIVIKQTAALKRSRHLSGIESRQLALPAVIKQHTLSRAAARRNQGHRRCEKPDIGPSRRRGARHRKYSGGKSNTTGGLNQGRSIGSQSDALAPRLLPAGKARPAARHPAAALFYRAAFCRQCRK